MRMTGSKAVYVDESNDNDCVNNPSEPISMKLVKAATHTELKDMRYVDVRFMRDGVDAGDAILRVVEKDLHRSLGEATGRLANQAQINGKAAV